MEKQKGKIWVGITVCLIYFGGVVFFYWMHREESNIWELTSYFSQIISGLFVVAGTVIAVAQYISNSNVSRKEADKQRKMEAAKMADEFRRNVIPLIDELSIAYSDSKLRKEVIDYLGDASLERFDKEEVERLFPKGTSLQYRILVAQNYLNQTDPQYKNLVQRYESDELTETERIECAKKLNAYVFSGYEKVNSTATKLSNSLEYMCICFNTNIADDETVYQSLHKVFFLAVHMVYIFTFEANTNEYDRLFYNVMVLYKKWRRLNKEKKQEEEQSKERLERQMNMLKEHYHERIPVRTKCE